MARIVSSASSSCCESAALAACRASTVLTRLSSGGIAALLAVGSHRDPPPRFPSRMQVEAHQHAFRVGQVSDETPEGRRQSPHQHGQGGDLHILGEMWMLVHVDDLQAVAALEMLAAECL